LLPYVIKKIKASRLNQGRIVFSHNRNEITIYAGELFQYFLKEQGIDFMGKVKLGSINKKIDKLIFRYHSVSSLDQVVAKLLEHSNNFITNQLLIAAGALSMGSPGTLSKGVALASDYAKNELKIKNITIAEGSGVSRNNRVSAIQIDRVLEKFLPYRHLMRRQGKEFYKTGTLYGINTRAGYIARANGELCRYVILLNTPGKFTDPIIFRLLRILEN
jgi:D-alanyl-D-alanine carboxypeptidase/D-alanyl-D-alanine-endopeptidase (penicillin-binding protein 4)